MGIANSMLSIFILFLCLASKCSLPGAINRCSRERNTIRMTNRVAGLGEYQTNNYPTT
jgi:hypothetical protein